MSEASELPLTISAAALPAPRCLGGNAHPHPLLLRARGIPNQDIYIFVYERQKRHQTFPSPPPLLVREAVRGRRWGAGVTRPRS